MIRLLIADDHPIVRDGLSGMFAAEPEFEVVGQAGDGAEAIRLAEELRPDVILMDLQMPGVGGIEATRRILDTSPHIRILVVTMFEVGKIINSHLLADKGGAKAGSPKKKAA